ncbi:ABC transporter permease [Flavobacterium sp. MAH-1]|uniref:ABC transporter permease n=1 Tax=Flavobacterium agri TaxID=2743471 RepID=A0A7Y9C5L8_9FLAO|nr:ABC transporter permease [Flavobacterium agri]NUY81407.1 ABC transporter permease [Flavobacterium agri]NYA71431.1 ABC transporter permease [Flavobacterium agri]
MNFPLYIAKRYLRTASKNNAINLINGIASISIVVGAAALFVVLSVFSGLKDFSLSFSNDFDPDLKALPKTGKVFTVTPAQAAKLQKIEGVKMISKVIEERVLFVFDGKEQVAYLKGVDSLFGQVNSVNKTIFQGQWLEPNTTQVVVGYGISQKLSLGLLDFNNPFEVYMPKPGKGDIENPDEAFTKAVLAPVGIYAISEELDSKYVFADLRLAQILLNYQIDQVSAVEFKLDANADVDDVCEEAAKILPGIQIKTRAELNESLYKMLNSENLVVYLIFTLVVIMALFSLAGALIVMIIEKKGNLKTLTALGVEVNGLRKIFLLQGSLLSLFAGIFGLALGSIVVLLQQHFKLIMITPTLAYPVVFTFQNIAIVTLTIFGFGFLASLIASSRVHKTLEE